MQSEYKEKQEDAKGKLHSDIQCTFCYFSEQRIFLHGIYCLCGITGYF